MDQKIIEALKTRNIEWLDPKTYANEADVVEYDDVAGFSVLVKGKPEHLYYLPRSSSSIEIPGLDNFSSDIVDLDRDPEVVAEEIESILYRLLEEAGVKLDQPEGKS